MDYEEYPPGSAPPAARTVPARGLATPYLNCLTLRTIAQGRALLCTEYSDEEYIAEKCGGSQDEYRRRVGRLYTGQLWRNDILPARYAICCPG